MVSSMCVRVVCLNSVTTVNRPTKQGVHGQSLNSALVGTILNPTYQYTSESRVTLKQRPKNLKTVIRSMGESQKTVVEEKLGISIRRNPSESFLQSLGVRSWSKWGCPASEFPWTYSESESCYLLKGKVRVTPVGQTDFVECGAGDFVQFPEGMSCTWKVSEPVDKHYKFG